MLSWKSIPPLVRIPLAYGGLSGALSLLFIISFFYFGKHPFYISPFFDGRVLLMAVLLFFALREVRDYFFEGILYLWQGMGGCLVFLGGMMLVDAIGIAIFSTTQSEFIQLYIDQGLAQIKTFSPEAIKQIGQPAVEELQKSLPNTTVSDMVRLYTVQTLILGIFVTIIISVISRRQPKTL
jgi:hypothetical protein